MPGAGDEQHIGSGAPDQPVEVDVGERQTGAGTPVAEQAWLDVRRNEWPAQQDVVAQVDLGDRQVVRGHPVPVEQAEFVVGVVVVRARCHRMHPPFAGEGDSILTARPGPRRGTGLGPTGSSVPPRRSPCCGRAEPGILVVATAAPSGDAVFRFRRRLRDEVRILYADGQLAHLGNHDAGHHHAGLAHDETRPAHRPSARARARVASASDEQGPAGEGAGVWCLPHRPPRGRGRIAAAPAQRGAGPRGDRRGRRRR